MDLYEEQTYDEWLDPEVRASLLIELKKRWENETTGNCVFVSATQRREIDQLRITILNYVREMYTKRYPYKTGFQAIDYGN
jgi:GTP-binding protein HflX